MQKKFSGRLPSRRQVLKCWELYVFLIPAIVFTILFAYVPLYGVQLAFKDLRPGMTISQSPWVGLKHFRRMFAIPDFPRIVKNTVMTAVVSNLISAPIPILFALLIDQVDNRFFKKTVQTVSYLPHLLSLVVVFSITRLMTSYSTGIINLFIEALGGERILFFGKPNWVIPIYIITDIWQNMGYGAIIYLAALAGVDQAQMEAAKIDGCNRLQVIWYIKIPAILPTIVTMQILRWGQLFSIGADKMLLIQTSQNLRTSEVLSTYVYKMGLQNMQYGFSTAVNLLNTAINIVCLLFVNALARKFSDSALF